MTDGTVQEYDADLRAQEAHFDANGDHERDARRHAHRQGQARQADDPPDGRLAGDVGQVRWHRTSSKAPTTTTGSASPWSAAPVGTSTSKAAANFSR